MSYVRQVLCAEAASCQKNDQQCQAPGIKVRMQQLAPGFVQQVQVSDPSCVARGKAWKSPCKACPKGQTEEEEIQLTLDILKGMADGDSIKFDQIADEAPGHIPGDVIFKISQAPHEYFTRDGDNLKMSWSVTLLESLIGFKKTFKHLDGHEVVLEKKDVTYCSEVYTVKGEGMPKKSSKGGAANQRGDLLVTFAITFPTGIFDPQRKEMLKRALS